MKLSWPWAKREHRHPSELLTGTMVCAGCGHLLLTGYIQNKEVAEVSFENGCRCERVLIYSHSCYREEKG